MSTETKSAGVRELALEPAVMEEWEDEDALRGVLSDQVIVVAGPEDLAAMLEKVRITLPAALNVQNLVDYAAERATELDLEIKADSQRFDYRLVEVPVNVLVPDPDKLVRLRLRLYMDSDIDLPVVAYDVFPPDQWSVTEHKYGEVNIDVTKALQFLCPPPLAPLTEALGFKLDIPVQWQTTTAQIDSTGRNANPAEWYVQDEQIGSAFAPLMVVRSGKGAAVTIRAELVGEVRRSVIDRIIKGRFQSRYTHDAVFSL